ncbi:MAG: hypothetical protein ACK57K_01775 [Chryseotalea sp.]
MIKSSAEISFLPNNSINDFKLPNGPRKSWLIIENNLSFVELVSAS